MLKEKTTKNNNYNEDLFDWKTRTKRRIFFELVSFLSPFIIVMFLIYCLTPVKQRAFIEKKISSDYNNYTRLFFSYQIDAGGYKKIPQGLHYIKWHSFKIPCPPEWIWFFSNAYGGCALFIKPYITSNYGVVVQVSDWNKCNSIPVEAEFFINRLGYLHIGYSKTAILNTEAYIFVVKYLTKSEEKIRADFIFANINNYFLKIIFFAPDDSYACLIRSFDMVSGNLSVD